MSPRFWCAHWLRETCSDSIAPSEVPDDDCDMEHSVSSLQVERPSQLEEAVQAEEDEEVQQIQVSHQLLHLDVRCADLKGVVVAVDDERSERDGPQEVQHKCGPVGMKQGEAHLRAALNRSPT
eukprot:scaffold179238_cov25-Prasinocladus_malaysianus.AAC.1